MTKRRSVVPEKFKFRGFVNLEYNDDEKVVIADWLRAFQPELSDSIVVLAEAGYRVAVSYNDHVGAFQCAITCKLRGGAYNGYCFTLVHADPGRGINILRYFYDSMLSTELYQVKDKQAGHDW